MKKGWGVVLGGSVALWSSVAGAQEPGSSQTSGSTGAAAPAVYAVGEGAGSLEKPEGQGAQAAGAGLSAESSGAAGGAASSSEEIFYAFDQVRASYAEQRRLGLAIALATGAGMLGTGIVGAARDEGWGTAFLISGGVVLGAGVLGYLTPNSMETLARRYGVDQPTHSPEQAVALEAAWDELARKAVITRYWGGALGIIAGGVVTGIGVAELSNTNSTSTYSERSTAGGILIGGGIACVGAGVVSLFSQTSVETGLEAYRQRRQAFRGPQASLGTIGLPGGAGLSLQGSF